MGLGRHRFRPARDEADAAVDAVAALAHEAGLRVSRYPSHAAFDSPGETWSRVHWLWVEGRSMHVVLARRWRSEIRANWDYYVPMYLPRPPWADWLAYYVTNAENESYRVFVVPRSYIAKDTSRAESSLARFAGAQGWRRLLEHTGPMAKPYEEIAPATLAVLQTLMALGTTVQLVDRGAQSKGPLKKVLNVSGSLCHVYESTRLSSDSKVERFGYVHVPAPRRHLGTHRILVVWGDVKRKQEPRFFVLPPAAFPASTTVSLASTLSHYENRWDLLDVRHRRR